MCTEKLSANEKGCALMIKLIVSDFDGTLLPYGQKSVSESVIEKINKLIDSGVYFAVASGRTYSELVTLLKDVSDRIYFICDDGALTVKNGTVIYKKQLSFAAVKTFFDDCLFKNVTFYAMDKAYILGVKNNIPRFGKTPQAVARCFEITEDIFKVSADVKSFELVNSANYRVHYSEGSFAEFVSPFANKGNAVSNLQLKLGVSKFETAIIGDADNDVPMVSYAKKSWAIGNRSAFFNSICTDCADSVDIALDSFLNI